MEKWNSRGWNRIDCLSHKKRESQLSLSTWKPDQEQAILLQHFLVHPGIAVDIAHYYFLSRVGRGTSFMYQVKPNYICK